MIPINILLFQLLLLTCNPSPNFAFQTPAPSRSSLPLAASTTASSVTSSSSLNEVVSTNQSPGLLLERIDQILNANSISTSQALPLDSKIILENIDRDHERDVRWAEVSSLPLEDANNGNLCNPIDYEAIQCATSKSAIAIQTKQSTPLLNEDEIQLLRRASESYWNRPLDGESEDSEKSRFTYQRKGNSEAHLSDVVKNSQQSNSNDITSLVDELFLNRVYPWIRESHLSKEVDGNDLALYVYDSLFIRYNATQANENNPIINGDESSRIVGAGQPLHRDLGYVSVNVMLNPQEEFEGGGTFFEDQLRPMLQSDNQPTEMQPLKPRGPGHGIAHYSSNRHAGAATFAGVRDILVIFLAATEKKMTRKAPQWEYNARIKAKARTYCSECSGHNIHCQLMCRILHHRLAVDQVLDDGEAWHYLGMALLDYHHHLQLSTDSAPDNNRMMESDNSSDNLTTQGGQKILELAVSCLNEAIKHTPCDGRLCNNLGIALERLLHCYNIDSFHKEKKLRDEISSAYRKSIMIHSTCEQVGCDVGADYESACLNYGLYLSKLDEFSAAIDVLSRIASPTNTVAAVVNEHEIDAATWARQRVIKDATNLLSFCRRTRDEQS